MLHDSSQNNCVIDHVSRLRQEMAKHDQDAALVFGQE
jgi:hypothetical protein